MPADVIALAVVRDSSSSSSHHGNDLPPLFQEVVAIHQHLSSYHHQDRDQETIKTVIKPSLFVMVVITIMSIMMVTTILTAIEPFITILTIIYW